MNHIEDLWDESEHILEVKLHHPTKVPDLTDAPNKANFNNHVSEFTRILAFIFRINVHMPLSIVL